MRLRKQKQTPSTDIALPISRELVEACQDWSIPVQIRFVQVNGQWQMFLRQPEQEVLDQALTAAMRQAVAQLAARQ